MAVIQNIIAHNLYSCNFNGGNVAFQDVEMTAISLFEIEVRFCGQYDPFKAVLTKTFFNCLQNFIHGQFNRIEVPLIQKQNRQRSGRAHIRSLTG